MTQKSDEDGWRGFLSLCSKGKNPEDYKDIFWLVLTPEERNAIGTRYLIFKELIKGEKTQREMAKDLGVSIAKITRGSNFLKTVNKNLRRMLEKNIS